MKPKLAIFLLIFCECCMFSQTQLYKSEPIIRSRQDEDIYKSVTLRDDAVIVDISSDRMMAVDKNNYRTMWDIDVGIFSDTSPYFYKDTFFHQTKKGARISMAQYEAKTGKMIKALPFESIWSKPYFSEGIMYFTGLMDGSKMIAYDIDRSRIVWEKQIGSGLVQPVYLRDKIIVNVEEDLWTEIDYDGRQISGKSRESVTIDSTTYNIKKYAFLTHDRKKINKRFLKKKILSEWDFIREITDKNTLILTATHLVVLGDNRKLLLNLDLGTIVSPDPEDYYVVSKIVKADDEAVWFSYQNHLVHYDFKNKKVLRDVNLTRWKPIQLVIDSRTIWLISSNDGQLYALDFEPDGIAAEKMAREKAIQDRLRCEFPDPKRVEAAKTAQAKIKNQEN